MNPFPKPNIRFSILASLLLFISCGEQTPEPIHYSGFAQGTTFHITYFDENGYDAEKAIDSVLHAIDQSMSTYLKNSAISKINHGNSTVTVDSMFAEVFQTSKKIYRESNGYFDPTVGMLVNYYGFGPEKMNLKIDSTTVDSLMQYVGFDKVKLAPDLKIKKANPNIYLDFNAIAQGYAVDRLGKLLDWHGIENYLIEVGGEIVAKGTNIAKGKPWTVGIDKPDDNPETRELSAIIKLENQGMATSGNYRKFHIDPKTGKKFVHTIDPLTGLPARNKLLSATVLAKNCMLADGYATALMAMGLEKSKKFLQGKPELDVYLIYAKGDSLGVFMTQGFEKKIIEE